jgi:flavin reductase (DIM6/NTAB) family NADH-FMN oxidoreductase RutF
MPVDFKKISREEIEKMEKIYRLNLVNSLSGIKTANLVGTISKENVTNLAIISSLVHLSSSPALLGMMLRPTSVPRHTYSNIKQTRVFSINMVGVDFIDKAHYTSAKFDVAESEFEKCGLTEEYFSESIAPCVKESPVKILMQYEGEYHIRESNTILIVGSIQSVHLPASAVDEKGMFNLEEMEIAGVSGLNTYYRVSKEANFAYARVGQFPQKER